MSACGDEASTSALDRASLTVQAVGGCDFSVGSAEATWSVSGPMDARLVLRTLDTHVVPLGAMRQIDCAPDSTPVTTACAPRGLIRLSEIETVEEAAERVITFEASVLDLAERQTLEDRVTSSGGVAPEAFAVWVTGVRPDTGEVVASRKVRFDVFSDGRACNRP